MTDHSALIERLGEWHQTRSDTAAYNGDERDCAFHQEAAAALRDQQARLEAANQNVCAFAAPWAVQYASDQGYPPCHIHFAHFDILEAAGARMVSFTRHVPSAPNQAKEAD